MSKKLTLADELAIFRNINGANKKVTSEHQDVINGDAESEVLRNQGVSRAKLRKFVDEEGLEFESWKNI